MTILAALCACASLFVIYRDLSPSFYSATATIRLKPLESDFGATLAFAEVLEKVASAQRLEDDADFKEAPNTAWRAFFRPASETAKTEHTPAVDALRKAVHLKQKEGSDLIEIDVRSTDPMKAATLASAIAHGIVDPILARAEAAKAALDAIHAEMAPLDEKIVSAEAKLAAIKGETPSGPSAPPSDSEAKRADAARAMALARRHAMAAKTSLEAAERADRHQSLEALPEDLKSPAIADLQMHYAQSRQELAQLRKTLGPKHPQLHEASDKVSALEARVTAELRKAVSKAAEDEAAAHADEMRAAASLAQLSRQDKSPQATLGQSSQLERDLSAWQTSRATLAASFDRIAAAQAKDAEAAIVSVSQPTAKQRSLRMNPLFLMLGLGLLAAIALALVRDLRIASPQQKAPEPVLPRSKPPPRSFRKDRLVESEADYGETLW